MTTAQTTIFTPDTIRTASVYPLATLEVRTAGTARVLVTRYWPRGLKRERVDYWLPDLAPSRGLLKAYRNGIPWETFAKVYRTEMIGDKGRLPSLFRALTDLMDRHGALTLLCVEHCPRDGHDESDVRCHRRILRGLLLSEAEETSQP